MRAHTTTHSICFSNYQVPEVPKQFPSIFVPSMSDHDRKCHLCQRDTGVPATSPPSFPQFRGSTPCGAQPFSSSPLLLACPIGYWQHSSRNRPVAPHTFHGLKFSDVRNLLGCHKSIGRSEKPLTGHRRPSHTYRPFCPRQPHFVADFKKLVSKNRAVVSEVHQILQYTQQALREANGELEPSDLLALVQFLIHVADMDVKGSESTVTIGELSRNFIAVAGAMFEKDHVSKWAAIRELVNGPMTVVQSIDRMAANLNLLLTAGSSEMVIDSSNIKLKVKQRVLSHDSAGADFYGLQSGNESTGDYISVPPEQIKDLQQNGFKKVTFVNTWYGSLHPYFGSENNVTQFSAVSDGSRNVPNSDRTTVHKNLIFALATAETLILFSELASSNKALCMAVTALLHLFFMASFTWMLVEGLLLWSKVVSVNISEDRRMKLYYVIGWGLPVIIIGITLATSFNKYVADNHCWLNVQTDIIWAFVGPVLFVLSVNAFVLFRVVMVTVASTRRRSKMLTPSSTPQLQAWDLTWAAIKPVLVLLPLLGLTWLCGVLVHLSVVLAYIFTAMNAFQGLYIFLVYAVYNSEVSITTP
ncbi:UNVERIFIED_CONTAM: hypothetical protein FKN15_043442 [Acipenser sinensis]